MLRLHTQTVMIGGGYFGGCTHSSIEAVISDIAAIAVRLSDPPPPDKLGLPEAITLAIGSVPKKMSGKIILHDLHHHVIVLKMPLTIKTCSTFQSKVCTPRIFRSTQ